MKKTISANFVNFLLTISPPQETRKPGDELLADCMFGGCSVSVGQIGFWTKARTKNGALG
jgi:hypothetical protein